MEGVTYARWLSETQILQRDVDIQRPQGLPRRETDLGYTSESIYPPVWTRFSAPVLHTILSFGT
jgi:hypothetical protein